MRRMRVTSQFTTRLLSGMLMAGLLLPLPALAVEGTTVPQEVLKGSTQLMVEATPLEKAVQIPGGDQIVNVAFRDVSVVDALRAVAKKGGFNVVADQTVAGNISVDLYGVRAQDALETIRTFGKLAYRVEGKTLMVTSADSPQAKQFQKDQYNILPLRYANAQAIATLLNQTLFQSTASDKTPKVIADSQTNSLLVSGTPSDVQLIREHLELLDSPRQMKTWRLNQANVLDVATLLASSVFNDGDKPILNIGGGSGGGRSASLRVRQENIKEGEGSADQGGSSSSSSSSGSGDSSSGSSDSGGSGGGSISVTNNVTLRSRELSDSIVQVSPDGPILIPDTRLNTLTVLATAEQIALVDSLLPGLDRRLPQVVIEAALIELREDARKEVGFNTGWSSDQFGFGVNNTQSSTYDINNPYTRPTGLPTSTTTPLESILQWSTHPLQTTRGFAYQLNLMMRQNKAKLLANPSITAAHDNEAIISIVDEIVKSVTVTYNFGVVVASTANIGEVGIVLSLLPKVGADGTINLRIRPTVSSIRSTTTDSFGNSLTLVSKREVLSQSVTMRDGESFVLGGLMQDSDTDAVTKVPGLSDLPIVGALTRSSTRNKNRTELLIVLTPHIVEGWNNAANTPTVLSSFQNTNESVAASAIETSPVNPAIQPAAVLPAQEEGPEGLRGLSLLSDPTPDPPTRIPHEKAAHTSHPVRNGFGKKQTEPPILMLNQAMKDMHAKAMGQAKPGFFHRILGGLGSN